VVTFIIGFVIGLVAIWVAMWLLGEVGAPAWLVLAPWVVPTVIVVVWTLVHPHPAVATDDDEAWVTYALHYVLFGSDEPRPTAVRVVTALLVGGPTMAAISVFWLLALVGLGDM
jgi:hypothetical protein